MRKLELLAPAKNLECGIAAIDCGADAVYIGAARFGARAAAGNSVDDIGQLCQYAHRFDAKVYVTLNTIIYDSEMDDTLALAEQLREAGVDALLLQDMGLVGRVALPIHASTQCDTRTAEKALWLESLGFTRVVLARELSLDEIAEIQGFARTGARGLCPWCPVRELLWRLLRLAILLRPKRQPRRVCPVLPTQV